MSKITNQTGGRFDTFVALGKSGTVSAVNALMENLLFNNDLASAKLVDYALSLVDTQEGTERIQYFLLNGNQQQRNFAALYFKRRGQLGLLRIAIERGLIDYDQAYAK